MNNQLVHTIGGKEYVLVQDLMTDRKNKNLQSNVNELGGIIVGLEIIHHWIFTSYIKVTVLMPIDKVFEYQKRDL